MRFDCLQIFFLLLDCLFDFMYDCQVLVGLMMV